jgi:N-acetylglucosaminyldiphosphoundecaprenol N-acetyl-beta-D-mannosaminyltransferase
LRLAKLKPVKTQMKKKNIINFPITCENYSKVIRAILNKTTEKKSTTVYFANVHMFIEAQQDPKLLQMIKEADIVAADGRPLIWSLKMLYNIEQERVAGMDLLPDLLHEMSLKNIGAFFYGGTDRMLEITREYLIKKYPQLKIAGMHSPAFGQQSGLIDEKILNQINDSTPSIVFVVLGCPKQEKWIASMKGKINTVMIGIGGAVPVMIGMQKRAPIWMQKNGLEWLFRLYQEPRRLFNRYFKTNILFLGIFFKEFIKIKILRSPNSSKLKN